ncbi:MAG TPA: ATP-dependent helicase C-terminal domain-containing protein, partial [Polyangiaceae bacterium]|nr:ATP-dependent helicase C-terminal domain-containing protein [Polyangiaceae bacterium]
SITVEGVTAVIDSGLARIAEHSPWTGRQSLTVRPIARASALQRAGRAGRTAPGVVLRLYTEASFKQRPEQEKPEIERLDLAGPLLTLLSEQLPLDAESWLDAPSPAALDAARALLERLELSQGDRLTELGRRALALPLSPRLARVTLAGEALGIPRRASLAAALLAERDLRVGTRGSDAASELFGCDCDLDLAIELYRSAEAERFSASALRRLGLHPGRVDTVRRSQEQIRRAIGAGRRGTSSAEDDLDEGEARRALALALLSGFPDRVARRREPGKSELILASGHTAQLARESVVRTAPLLIALDAEDRAIASDRSRPGASRSQLLVRLASPLEAEWLLDHAASGLSERELLDWDAEREKALLTSQLCWGAVVLEQSQRPAPTGGATAELVERAALGQLANLFGKAETLPVLMARTELLATQLPALGLEPVRALGTRGLLHTACARVNSLGELRALDWQQLFLEQLTPEQQRALEREAPETVLLRGGRRVRVQYAEGQAPWIESRLQDFFGMQTGPTLCSGRVPLTLHLLAPNQRAVQVTTDLAGFWERHYPSIRRELERKYPKHAWPADPLNVQPAMRPRAKS